MNTQVTRRSNIDVDGCVKLYLELRQQKADMKAKFEESLKPISDGMAKLETALLGHMQSHKAKHIATDAGTVYQRVERKATIKDREAFREYVTSNGLFDLVDFRANKPAVFTHIEETQKDVPGVNTSAYMTIGVRKADAGGIDDE